MMTKSVYKYSNDHFTNYKTNNFKENIFLLFFLMLSNSLFAETLLDFNFKDNELTKGFGKWQYEDKGTNLCGVYNGHTQSKLCSVDNLNFYLYYNPHNNNHIGWMRFGFIDSDDTFSITGSSLKVKLTGGAYSDATGNVSHIGSPIFSKKDFTGKKDYGDNSMTKLRGGTTLYLKGPSTTSTFPALQEKNRLTMWVLLPKIESSLDYYSLNSLLKRPNITMGLYPFIDRSTGGHYYHFISNIPMGGWTKIQFDAHPQHHNAGSNNPYGAFPVGGNEYPSDGVSYFNNITTLAFVVSNQQTLPTDFYIDDISSHLTFYENDETINNVAIGFDQENKLFDVSFSDKYKCLQCGAKYLIKYSFNPISLSNFEQANTPEKIINFNRLQNNKNGEISKPNPGYNNIWAALKIQKQHLEQLTEGKTIYFAIKDISDRSNIKQEPIDFAEQLIPNIGNIKTIDLLKTIDYTIHFVNYPLTLKTTEINQIIENLFFSQELTASGGSPPYQFSTLSSLPSKMELTNNGFLVGSPNEAGEFIIDITITDAKNHVINKTLNFIIKSRGTLNITNCNELVNFASIDSKDIITSNAFNKVIADKYTGNLRMGKSIRIGGAGGYNYQGIQGTGLPMMSNDSIRSIWFNNSDKEISFTPIISFNDPDRSISGNSGQWVKMTPTIIKANQWAVSHYIFPKNWIEKNVNLINISVNYNNHQTLILDKIEYTSPKIPEVDICTLPYPQ